MLQRHPDRSPQREWVPVAGFAALGLACGVAAKLADGSAPRWLTDAANYPAAYVLALAVIARVSPTAALAAQRSTAFFTSLCLAYYGWSQYVLGFVGGRYLFVWGALAVTLVPTVTAIVWRATRGSGVVPGLVIAGVAAVPLAEGPLRQLWLVYARGVDLFLLHPVQAALDVVAAVVIAGVLPRHPRTRLLAVAFSVPMYLIVSGAWDFLRALLGV